MFIDIFLMCFIAQSYVCGQVQPVSTQVKIQAENATADHKSTIFSVIRNAGKCVAYKDLRLDAKFRQLEEYCERPLPDTPRANEFLSYEVVLCMVLFDAVQRFCKVGHQEVTKDLQNFSGGFSCNNMIKGVPEAFAESSEQWVTIFKAKLGSISDCERACIQDKMVSPVCEYIWKTNTMTYQAQVSSATSAGELNFVLVGCRVSCSVVQWLNIW
jgi:phage host-nuclease inhibitor protein Gam